MPLTNPGTLVVTAFGAENVAAWHVRTFNQGNPVSDVLVAKETPVGDNTYHVSLASTQAAINPPNQGQELQINVAGVNPAGESSATGAPETAIFWNIPVAPAEVHIAQ